MSILDKEGRVPEAHIEELLAACKIQTRTFFENTLVMVAQLPNGYTVTVSSGCINPDNYSKEIGRDICLGRLKNRLWELEGYVGAYEFSSKKK